jgi:hypothetical protein
MKGETHMNYPEAFIAGFASTLVFHQGVLWLLYAGGFSQRAPWNMTPVPPLNAPAVISLAFWGSVWVRR